jgi:hypothetical protein
LNFSVSVEKLSVGKIKTLEIEKKLQVLSLSFGGFAENTTNLRFYCVFLDFHVLTVWIWKI